MASLFDSIRFSEGWYLSRVYALVAGSSLLVVLLAETLLLHRRYEQHQRQLIAEVDHRVKNILAQVAGVATATREGRKGGVLKDQALCEHRTRGQAVAGAVLPRVPAAGPERRWRATWISVRPITQASSKAT